MASSLGGSAVDYADGLQAAREVMALIDGPSVVAGGMAMRLYGFIRNTKDVDIISTTLPRIDAAESKLSFGGRTYHVSLEPQVRAAVVVDVIVRDDELVDLYMSAARTGRQMQGVPVINPEHLAVIKYFAGRAKDRLDLQFLLLHELFSVSASASLMTEVFSGTGGKVLAREFVRDMETELFMARHEQSK